MSYQVLARKWRPKTFAEVVGQAPVLTALANSLRENRLHHAYLFSGTRGVGKTSIARLFAKGLNCEQGVSAEPCGICEHCKAIEEGRFIDLIEIDAASRTKVEDTRELLDNVQYKPVQGRYKVYLIDEVHMLSRHSFNALLKTLEEPPEYVKFLLATTDPQKLPVTILSRCMQFHLKALEQTQIAQHLAHILTQENIAFDTLAVEKLAKAAEGSLRDSLSLTDQAIAMGNGQVSKEIVNQMLGLLDDNQPIEILYALQAGNGEALMKAVRQAGERGADWDGLLAAVAENLHHIAMLQLLPSNIDEQQPLGFLAKHIAPQDLQFYYQIILNGRQELALAPNRQMGVEMVLLRALAFHPKLLAETAAIVTETSHEALQSAVKNSQVFEMPVVSQTIKATYQPKLTPTNTPATKLSSQSHSSAALSATTLDVLDALNQLEKPVTSTSDELEKKNASGLNTLQNSQEKTAENLTALSVVDMPLAKAEKNLSKSSSAANTNILSDEAENEEPVDNADNSDAEEILSAETYRWEWINPEMAEEEQAIRPSEIKQAILQNMTEALQQRIIDTTCQLDEWTNLIEKIGISGLLKEMALHSFILQQTEDTLVLGLAEKKSHLFKEKNTQQLQQIISEFYQKPLRLDIQLVSDAQEEKMTPAAYRHKVYQQFYEQAKQELQIEPQILLLQREFDGALDLDSIRPV
ncbi:MAG: DNA polymerase III subunit gamma/tau [[Pasteurella] aerogenes]|nr:DNA polymerase III subunit gamma/tau [[Pasteurella] aerogenes]